MLGRRKQHVGRSVDTMPASERNVRIKNKLNVQSPQHRSQPEIFEDDDELIELRKKVYQAE